MIHFHTLRHRQWIPRPLDEVWAFFSDPRNLEAITPPWLGFRTLTPGSIEMRPGALIRYRIYWHLVPLGWTTRIRRCEPPSRFIDVQESGPYSLWHHTHRFAAKDGGTEMRDIVRYRLPLGPLGRLMHALQVRRDLERIFQFRHDSVEHLLGKEERA